MLLKPTWPNQKMLVALPDTPARSLDIEDFSGAGVASAITGEGNAEVGKLDPRDDKEPYHETEMVST